MCSVPGTHADSPREKRRKSCASHELILTRRLGKIGVTVSRASLRISRLKRDRVRALSSCTHTHTRIAVTCDRLCRQNADNKVGGKRENFLACWKSISAPDRLVFRFVSLRNSESRLSKWKPTVVAARLRFPGLRRSIREIGLIKGTIWFHRLPPVYTRLIRSRSPGRSLGNSTELYEGTRIGITNLAASLTETRRDKSRREQCRTR